MMPSSSSCASHARFLRSLVEREEIKARQMESTTMDSSAIDPALQSYPAVVPSRTDMAGPEDPVSPHASHHRVPSSGHVHNGYSFQPYNQPPPHMMAPGPMKPAENGEIYPGNLGDPNERAERLYYENMCRELGVTGNVGVGVDLINCYDIYPRAGTQYTMMGN